MISAFVDMTSNETGTFILRIYVYVSKTIIDMIPINWFDLNKYLVLHYNEICKKKNNHFSDQKNYVLYNIVIFNTDKIVCVCEFVLSLTDRIVKDEVFNLFS